MARMVKFSQMTSNKKPNIVENKNLIKINEKIGQLEQEKRIAKDTLALLDLYSEPYTLYMVLKSPYKKYLFKMPIKSVKEYDIIKRVIITNSPYHLMEMDINTLVNERFIEYNGNILNSFIKNLIDFKEHVRNDFRKNKKLTILGTILAVNYTDNSFDISSLDIFQHRPLFNNAYENLENTFRPDGVLIKNVLLENINEIFPYLMNCTYNSTYPLSIFDSSVLAQMYVISKNTVKNTTYNATDEYLTLELNS